MATEPWMDVMTAVRGAVDRLLAGEPGPMLDLLAEDVHFEVAGGGEVPRSTRSSGRQAVADYFDALGALVAFWQMDYGTAPGQVIAWGKEDFTVEGCGLQGGCEFALVFELDDGAVGRLLVVEDFPEYIRDGGSLATSGRADLAGLAVGSRS